MQELYYIFSIRKFGVTKVKEKFEVPKVPRVTKVKLKFGVPRVKEKCGVPKVPRVPKVKSN